MFTQKPNERTFLSREFLISSKARTFSPYLCRKLRSAQIQIYLQDYENLIRQHNRYSKAAGGNAYWIIPCLPTLLPLSWDPFEPYHPGDLPILISTQSIAPTIAAKEPKLFFFDKGLSYDPLSRYFTQIEKLSVTSFFLSYMASLTHWNFHLYVPNWDTCYSLLTRIEEQAGLDLSNLTLHIPHINLPKTKQSLQEVRKLKSRPTLTYYISETGTIPNYTELLKDFFSTRHNLVLNTLKRDTPQSGEYSFYKTENPIENITLNYYTREPDVCKES